jgi:opacity protein-like surface antigen
MNTTLTLSALTLAILLAAAPACAQSVEIQGFEVTPFIGGRFGGTFDVQPAGAVETRATLKDSVSYGVSAGVRFDDFSLIEFRWTRASSALKFDTGLSVNPLAVPAADVTLNQFHGDFTREFPLEEMNRIRPFLMASVGATHLGNSSNGFTRFSFGIGTGLKVAVNPKLGFRVEARWLPIWVQPEVSSFACGFGGCVAVLSGRLTQQFELTAGPVFRF